MSRALTLAAVVACLVLGQARAESADPKVVETLLVRHSVASGSFTQAIDLVTMRVPIRSRGRFYFDEARGVAWYVDEPIPSLTTLTPAGLRVDGRAIDTGGGAHWIVDLLQAMLRADVASLASMFTVHCDIVDGSWTLRLVPDGNALARIFSDVELAGASAVRSVVLTNIRGDVTTIHLADIEPLDALPQDVLRALEH